MEKEKKNVTETTGTNVTETTADVTNAPVLDETLTGLNLFVERSIARDRLNKPIKTKSGENLYNYRMYRNVRGKDVRIDFGTSDNGGYEPLEIVFMDKDKAELNVTIKEFKGDDGKARKMFAYEVISVDENTGFVYRAPVKPARTSDRSMLEMYLGTIGMQLTA